MSGECIVRPQDHWVSIVQGVVDLLSPRHAYEKILDLLTKTTLSSGAGMALLNRCGSGEWEFIPSLAKEKLKKCVQFFQQLYSGRSEIQYHDSNFFFYPLYNGEKEIIGVVFLEKSEEMQLRWDSETETRTRQMVALLQPILQREEKMNNDRKKTESKHLGLFIGESAQMHKVYRNIQKVAPSEASVIVTGESGTGKELVAQAIHDLSDRRNGPMIDVNCAAIPQELMESEFFGHEKGAFSGATGVKQGKFELASGGTLFLDEIGEMPMALQVKFLRVLQERKVWRVGGQKPIPVDVRIVTATHRNLKERIRKGQFRADLYYRLHTFPIHLPALQKRGDDIELLAHHFLHQLSVDIPGFTPEAINALKNYPWPGNVRELHHEIERAVLIHDGVEALPAHALFSHLNHSEKPALVNQADIEKTLDFHIMMTVKNALTRNRFNKSRTARELGIYAKRLDRLIKKYSI